jgi:uncharacterized circularly permuted ATP-grasp superfamily protein/uncharacterized alpha-E superfamily protein
MQQTYSINPHKEDTNNKFCSYYQCLDGIFDEMCMNSEKIRPHWEDIIRSLNMLGRVELERRWQEAYRLLRDNGVTYNMYGDPQGRDRPWQLDPIPLLISSQEWSGIERGLIQRAELLSLLLADLYGPRETLHKGLLPVELIASYPGFLRPCMAIQYPIRHRLPWYAIDLARTSNGQWWALADYTQAPAGAGYALENRLVMSRVLPSLFRNSHVHRLSLFFRTLRATLASMSSREDHRIVLLTAGPDNETYFEHAYLAKYLGYTLVQGADLMVRDGKVRLKTLGGLQPVEVILRRVDDLWCDPLELHPDSYSGVAGLLQAVRLGNVAMANPLGTSILENPGLLSYLPKLARHFLDEDLLIPSPSCWWCGDPQSRQYVLANLNQLVIKRTSYHSGKKTSFWGRLLSSQQSNQLRDQIRTHPHWFVGCQEVQYSTTPIFTNGRFEPRQMVLRSFLVSSEDEHRVMPGGLTRVSSNPDSPFFSTQGAGISKDTWVLASEPESESTLLHSFKQPFVAFEGKRELPSRVAENLFWLGRYAERADSTSRLLRTVLLYLAEPYDFPGHERRTCLHSLLRAVTLLTETYPGFIGTGAQAKLEAPENELLSVFLDQNRMGSLSSTLRFLLSSAKSVRDRISPDIWRVITDIDDQLQTMQRDASVRPSDALAELDNLILALAAFAGLSIENMTHGQGWLFLMIGRRLERAVHLTSLFHTTLTTISTEETALLENLLGVTDSLLSYRRYYRSHPEPHATLELILRSESNPRSLGYQLVRLTTDIAGLPRNEIEPYRTSEERLILEALTQLRLADMETLAQPTERYFRKELDQLLTHLGKLLPKLSDALTHSHFSHADQPRQLVQLGMEVD